MTSITDWRDFYKQRAQELYQPEIVEIVATDVGNRLVGEKMGKICPLSPL